MNPIQEWLIVVNESYLRMKLACFEWFALLASLCLRSGVKTFCLGLSFKYLRSKELDMIKVNSEPNRLHFIPQY